jgi:hypothetical protein
MKLRLTGRGTLINLRRAADVFFFDAKIAGGFADAIFMLMAPAVLSLHFIWLNLTIDHPPA